VRTGNANSIALHVAETGDETAPALVFSNSLGTDFRIWNEVLPLLDPGLRVLRYDKRGHGLSDCPPGPWTLADHVADLAGLLDSLGIKRAVICGLSVGGLIAPGLAAERPDLVKALILCDTAAKIGDVATWNARIDAVETDDIASIAEPILERWFSAEYRAAAADMPIWRNLLNRTPTEGYAATCRAIRDADYRESTMRLRLPCLTMAGDEDGYTPPDMVRETAALIPSARLELIKGAGHLPCIEKPAAVAGLINRFLVEVGHF
jgi:3-oxoadipate enol-lactonase